MVAEEHTRERFRQHRYGSLPLHPRSDHDVRLTHRYTLNSFSFGVFPGGGAPSVGEAKWVDAVVAKARAAMGT